MACRNGTGINVSLDNISNNASLKLDVNVSLNEILEIAQVPPIPPIASQFAGLFADSLSTVDSEGNSASLSPTQLLNSIGNALNNMLGTIENTVTNTVNGAIGVFNVGSNGPSSDDIFAKIQSDFLGSSYDLQFSVDSQICQQSYGRINSSQLGQLQQQTIPNISSLTPRQIRDISTSPNLFQGYVTSNVQQANSNLTNTAMSNTNDLTNNPVIQNTAQYKGTVLSPNQPSPSDKTITVRRTGYWSHPYDGDEDSVLGNSSTGLANLREGISCAVDPNLIPYGSKIIFPDIGVRIAMDTGSAVSANTAARSSGENVDTTIDIYYVNKTSADQQLNSVPEVITVTIQPPRSGIKQIGTNRFAATSYKYGQSAEELANS